MGRNGWIAVLVGATLLLALVGGAALWITLGNLRPAVSAGNSSLPSSHSSPSPKGSPTSSRTPSPTSGSTASPAPSSASPSPLGTPIASPTAAGQPSATPAPGTPAPPTSTPPTVYSFQPPVSGSGTTPSASFVTADLVMTGQVVVAGFHVSSPGAVSAHAFAGLAGLVACLRVAGGSCTPTAVPNPAFWTINGDDLAHATDYETQVQLPGSGLGGLDFGWNGPRHTQVSGVRMTGSCSAAAGYAAGCGLRFRVQAGRSMTVAAGQGDLHLKVRDKVTNAVAFDHRLPGSASFSLPDVGLWTGYLYPETSAPAYLVTVVVDWA